MTLTSILGDLRAELVWNPQHSHTAGLEQKKVVYMLGRERPVMFASRATSRTISCSGVVCDDEYTNRDAWEKIAVTPEPLLYRDPSGAYMWLCVGDVDIRRQRDTRSWIVAYRGREVGDPRG